MHVLWVESALYCYVVLYVYILENACSWVECALYCYVILCVYILENACSLGRIRLYCYVILCVYGLENACSLGGIRFILLCYIMWVYCRECMIFWSNPLYTVMLYYVGIL